MGESSAVTPHERRYVMKYTGRGLAMLAILIIVLGVADLDFANRSSVMIKAPGDR